MILYKGMDADTLEAEYNLTKRRGADSFAKVAEHWSKRSAKFQVESGAQVDIAYGEGERDKFDFFYSGNPNGPLLIYIHGGYWQRGDKSMYSFIAEPFIKHGISVAVINYNLTPSVRMGQIPPQIRKAIAWCFQHADELQFNKDKLHLSGHSAGGHLGAMMMATDWSAYDSQLPTNLIKSGLLISGVYELEPIVHTSLNEGPQMDIPEATTESPTFMSPVTNAPQLVVYGGGETNEFHRQSIDYANKFRTTERAVELYEVPMADHYDELDRLVEEDSTFFEKACQLIRNN
ncbi:MAG: arylformamidase [Cocleimonas sp.]|jgi:arylformamidase